MEPMHFPRWQTLLVPITLAAIAIGQGPTVLYDVNATSTSPASSNPGVFVALGSSVLFAAETQQSGRELWRTDTTTNTTALVAEIRPDVDGSNPLHVTAGVGVVWFTADDGVHGRELWKSDGTAAGTTMVADLIPGSAGPAFLEFVAVGANLFFVCNALDGHELWRSDGTATGTVQVRDLMVGPASSFPTGLLASGSRVFFQAATSVNGTEPYVSDGTAAGTTLLADVVAGPNGSFPTAFTTLGSVVLFGANQSLWRTDGTPAGTFQVASPGPGLMVAAGALAWFTAGGALWTTDGTAGNANHVAGLSAGMFGTIPSLTVFGTSVLAQVNRGQGAPNELWIAAPTLAPQLLYQQAGQQNAAPVVAGSFLCFAGIGPNGQELWRSDGTAAGTFELLDITPGGSSSPIGLVAMPGNRVWFSASTNRGREPWVTDGTAAGTRLVADVAATANTPSSDAAGFTDVAGITYFAADADGTGATLWRTDGTPAGTWAVVPPGPARPLGPTALTAVGTRLFFTAYNAQYGNKVWTSDGTAAGTLAIDANPGSAYSSPSPLVAGTGQLWFLAYSPGRGRSLWRTDGTPAGTVAVTSNPFEPITELAVFGHGAVFSRTDLGIGSRPYFTDGTPAGTVRLPGAGVTEFVALNDRCYFTEGDRATLRVTDGTPAGTTTFLDLLPGSQDHFGRLHVVGSHLWFVASSATAGQELWRSDGTPAGTALVLDSVPGTNGAYFHPVGSIGSLNLFSRDTGNDLRLWRSDGTANGTYELIDRPPVTNAIGDGRYLWFATEDGAGRELWRTDGTVNGTMRMADLFPGVTSSLPHDFAVSNGRILFAATHPTLGIEPWVLTPGAVAQPIGHGCMLSGSASRLRATPPVLGTAMAVHIDNGPPAGAAFVLGSLFTTGSFRFPGGRCDLFVDPSFLTLAFLPLTNGAAAWSMPVPPDPWLAGLPLRLQSLLFPNATLVGVEATNAMAVTLGL